MHTPPHSHPGPPSAICLREAQLFSGLKQAEKKRELLRPQQGRPQVLGLPQACLPFLSYVREELELKSQMLLVRSWFAAPRFTAAPELSFLPGTYKLEPHPLTVLKGPAGYRVGSFHRGALFCDVFPEL